MDPRAPELAARALALCASGSPRQIAARLSRGDPLKLLPHVERELARRALLLDAAHVRALLVARLALGAQSWRGRPAWPIWLGGHLSAAVESALAGSRAVALAAGPGAGARPPLGAARSSAAVARMLSAFHGQAQPERAAFLELVVRGRDLDAVARAAGVSASEIGRRARRVLDACLAAVEVPEVPEAPEALEHRSAGASAPRAARPSPTERQP